MVVIKIMYGLGNQMFQYCLFKSYQKKGLNVRVDIEGHEKNCMSVFSDNKYNKNGFMLEQLFNVKCEYANSFDVKFARLMPAFGKTKKGIMRLFNTVYTTNYEEAMFSKDEIFSKQYQYLNHGYLKGAWQYTTHYDDVIDEVKKDFTFKLPLDKKNQSLADKIKSSNSVGIHVRRGDYLKYVGLYYALGKKYYSKAIDIIKERENKKEIELFVFSDDIEWCKKNLGFDNATYIDGNFGDKNYIDMQLMSLCKHNIIANSTFSLWAAILNDNPNKTVVAPVHFMKEERDFVSKMMPKEFVLIDNVDEPE